MKFQPVKRNLKNSTKGRAGINNNNGSNDSCCPVKHLRLEEYFVATDIKTVMALWTRIAQQGCHVQYVFERLQ